MQTNQTEGLLPDSLPDIYKKDPGQPPSQCTTLTGDQRTMQTTKMQTDIRCVLSCTGILTLILFFHVSIVHAIPISLQHRSEVICDPSTWQSIVAFFVLNYATHAMTIKSFPGDTTRTKCWWTALALFVPFAGVWRGCQSIARGSLRRTNDLQDAARAGALCAVTRWDPFWQPERGEDIPGCRVSGYTSTRGGGGNVKAEVKVVRTSLSQFTRTVSIASEKVHGDIPEERIREGNSYILSIVPHNFKVVPRYNGKVTLSYSTNTLKCMAAIIQLVFACITLYQVRGDQITRFGYASFGLTVIPYAVMSLVNLTANIVTPDYPTLYVVHSEVLEEVEKRRGCKFDGTVGTFEVPPEEIDEG